MALDALLDSLTVDADGEARALVDAARAEADRLRAEAEARVEERCNASVAQREVELAFGAGARRARTLHEGRAHVMAAREKSLNRIFAGAEARLREALRRDGHQTALAALITEAAAYFPDGEVEAHCTAAIASMVRELAPQWGIVRVIEDESVPLGVMLCSADGTVRVDATLADRLRRLRPALSIEVLARMETPS